MTAEQLSFLPPTRLSPEGFRYDENLITAAEEARLVEQIGTLPFREFEFHGYLGKRRVVSFGLHYETDNTTTEMRISGPWNLADNRGAPPRTPPAC